MSYIWTDYQKKLESCGTVQNPVGIGTIRKISGQDKRDSEYDKHFNEDSDDFSFVLVRNIKIYNKTSVQWTVQLFCAILIDLQNGSSYVVISFSLRFFVNVLVHVDVINLLDYLLHKRIDSF
jgi:hypothetical protein